MKPILIVIEGQDRTGKDTILDNIKSFNPEIYIYKQKSHEDTGVDYRNKEEYEQWVLNHVNNQLDEMIYLSKYHKIIACTRLVLSDNVYSDLFGREHIVENNLTDKINQNFDIKTFILLWDNFEDYKKRVDGLQEELEYEKDEFNRTKELYLKYAKVTDKILLIENSTSKTNVYKNFASNILRNVLEQ